MKKLFYLGLFLFGAISCTVDNEVQKTPESLKTLNLIGGVDATYSFGPAGYVTVTNDGTSFYVKFVANAGHKLEVSRLEIVNSPSDFPVNGAGYLNPGNMDNFVNHGGGEDDYTYSFLLSDYGDCIYISPWAIFSNGGSDTNHYAGDILGGRVHPEWWYFKYGECSTTTTNVCNSAYMYFCDLTVNEVTQTNTCQNNGSCDIKRIKTLNSNYSEKPTASNWGWYIDYNVAIDGTSHEYPLIAGAGLNDICKGFQIGTATVSVVGTKITVTTNLDPGFTDDTHVFIGNALPAKRPAPGKFESLSTVDLNGDFFDIDGKFKIIVHSKICWNE